MAEGNNTVWIDTTFIPKEDALDGTKDVKVEFFPARPDNIGSRSIPVIYRVQEAVPNDDIYIDISYETFPATLSGLINVAEEYYLYPLPMVSGVMDSLLEYSHNELQESTQNNIYHIYSTGFYTISGAQDKRIAFTSGNLRPEVIDIAHAFSTSTKISGALDYVVNYSNFSGNIGPSGEPIPFYNTGIDIPHEYTRANNEYIPGGINRIIDVSFAGWVLHNIGFDAYSVLLGFDEGFDYEVSISGGGVDVHYLDVYATTLTLSGVELDVYCALTELATNDFEAETIPGRIARKYYDVYSCAGNYGALNLDIDLFPIKITNFSLDVDEHTDAENSISVDILDDTCLVSTSGTYFKVDGVRVPVTLMSITDGYRMYYDPEDNFSSLEGPTTFTAHAENECGQTLEKDYYLTFGYIVEYDNHPGSWQGIDYGFKKEVVSRVTAENYASCPQVSSLAWGFESKELFNKDLGASIVGKFFRYEHSEFSAEIRPQSLAYFYGKEFEVVLTAKDFAGNEMEPLILKYKIEDKPEN